MLIAVSVLAVLFHRATRCLLKTDPAGGIGWCKTGWLLLLDSRKRLLPSFFTLFGSNTLTYFRPGFSPESMGSTAQAVAYLASSPAARAAHL